MVADAIIGIAVGVGVVFCIVILLVVLIICVCRKYKKTDGTKKTDDINTVVKKTDTNMYTMDPVNDKNIDDE